MNKITDNDNYGLYKKDDYKVYGKDGKMNESYATEYRRLISGEISIDEYRNIVCKGE